MTPRALIAPARLAGGTLMRTQTDERLVDLVRAGNDGAFEAIVSRYSAPLLRYCKGFLPEARAEDTVQQTFVRALAALRESEAEMRLRPWLYRIAHNTALNDLRDRSLEHAPLDLDIDGVERPDQAFERKERMSEVLAAVKDLPARQRDALVLRELEGRSYMQIASELGVSDGSARQLIHRGRNALRGTVTALTPLPLLTRLPFAEPAEGMTARISEVVGAGAGGAVLAKACATAVVTGAVIGGVAGNPTGPDHQAGARGATTSEERTRTDATASPAPRLAAGEPRGSAGSIVDSSGPGGGGDGGGRGRGRGGDEESHSGRDPAEDRSGPGGGGDQETLRAVDDNSGPGSGSDDPAAPAEPDNSGSDSFSSGSGSSGSGSSGSGSSGTSSGSSGSGSDGTPDEPVL